MPAFQSVVTWQCSTHRLCRCLQKLYAIKMGDAFNKLNNEEGHWQSSVAKLRFNRCWGICEDKYRYGWFVKIIDKSLHIPFGLGKYPIWNTTNLTWNTSKSSVLTVSISRLRLSIGPKFEVFRFEIIFSDYQTSWIPYHVLVVFVVTFHCGQIVNVHMQPGSPHTCRRPSCDRRQPAVIQIW